MRMVRRGLLCLLLYGLLAACGSQPSDPGKASLPGLRVTAAAPGWSVYHTSDGLVRLRKSGTEAIVDLAAHPLENFDALVQQYSQVSAPAEITEDASVDIDGAPARRISFAGKRPDTGVPTGGTRYVMRHRRHAYVFEYLDAGAQIDGNRKEAQGMIEAIRLDK